MNSKGSLLKYFSFVPKGAASASPVAKPPPTAAVAPSKNSKSKENHVNSSPLPTPNKALKGLSASPANSSPSSSSPLDASTSSSVPDAGAPPGRVLSQEEKQRADANKRAALEKLAMNKQQKEAAKKEAFRATAPTSKRSGDVEGTVIVLAHFRVSHCPRLLLTSEVRSDPAAKTLEESHC